MGVSDVCSVLEKDRNSPHDSIPGRRLDGDDLCQREASLVPLFETQNNVAYFQVRRFSLPLVHLVEVGCYFCDEPIPAVLETLLNEFESGRGRLDVG